MFVRVVELEPGGGLLQHLIDPPILTDLKPAKIVGLHRSTIIVVNDQPVPRLLLEVSIELPP
jgi:hypothetical protein